MEDWMKDCLQAKDLIPALKEDKIFTSLQIQTTIEGKKIGFENTVIYSKVIGYKVADNFLILALSSVTEKVAVSSRFHIIGNNDEDKITVKQRLLSICLNNPELFLLSCTTKTEEWNYFPKGKVFWSVNAIVIPDTDKDIHWQEIGKLPKFLPANVNSWLSESFKAGVNPLPALRKMLPSYYEVKFEENFSQAKVDKVTLLVRFDKKDFTVTLGIVYPI